MVKKSIRVYENRNIILCAARLRRTEGIKAASLLLNGHRANEGPLSALSQQFTPRRMKLAARYPLCALGQRGNIKQYTHAHAHTHNSEKKGKAEEVRVESLLLRFSGCFPGVLRYFSDGDQERVSLFLFPGADQWFGLIQSDPRKASGWPIRVNVQSVTARTRDHTVFNDEICINKIIQTNLIY